MTSPAQTIQSDLKHALKSGDKLRVSTLRLLLNALENERIRAGEAVDEAAFHGLVQKAIKQRKESAEQYRKGDRPELAEKEESEAEILAGYLPPAAGEEEIRAAVSDFAAAQGLSGPAAIGPIMKEMLARFSGRADGSTINKIAREVLAARTASS